MNSKTLLDAEIDAARKRDFAAATRFAEERIKRYGVVQINRGGVRALTMEQAEKIRESVLSAEELAERYGVAISQVHSIRKGETYVGR